MLFGKVMEERRDFERGEALECQTENTVRKEVGAVEAIREMMGRAECLLLDLWKEKVSDPKTRARCASRP